MRAPRNLHHHSWRQRTSWTIGQTQNCPGNDLSPAGPREQSKIEKASSPFPSLQSQSSLSQPISKLSCSWPFARRYTERLKIQYNFHIKLILFWLQDHHHHNHSLCQRSSSWRRPGGFWNSGCTRAPASLRTSPSSSVLTLPKMAMLKCDSSIFALGNQVPLMGNPPSISCEGHCQHDYCTFSPFRNLPFSQTSKGLFETLSEQDSLQKPPPPQTYSGSARTR